MASVTNDQTIRCASTSTGWAGTRSGQYAGKRPQRT